ncbi:MAG: hypothetical protein HY447_01625 [Candidatus Omnitrophica bacterium]|nr:hypothetical protein [Candidatus Omnitrophota bacterium]
MKRRSVLFAKRLAFKVKKFLLFLILSLIFSRQVGAGETLRMIDGKIKEISLEKHELVLSYKHPVTSRSEELKLIIDDKTSADEGVRLEDLRGDDPVSVTYEEIPGGLFYARDVRRVPLRGVPIKEIPR